jgi:hypothetical protein
MLHLLTLVVQDSTVTGGTSSTGLDPAVLIPAIASVFNVLIMYAFKTWLKPFWDRLPDVAKSLIVGIESTGFVFLAKLVGTTLGGDIFGWTPEMWQAVLVWGMSMGWHAAFKQATTSST